MLHVKWKWIWLCFKIIWEFHGIQLLFLQMFIEDFVGIEPYARCQGYLNLPFWASVSPFVNCTEGLNQGFFSKLFLVAEYFCRQNLIWKCNKNNRPSRTVLGWGASWTHRPTLIPSDPGAPVIPWSRSGNAEPSCGSLLLRLLRVFHSPSSWPGKGPVGSC